MSAVYIHFPFCKKKCFYCDFYSVTNTEQSDAYIKNLKREIGIRMLEYSSPVVTNTLFIGGGTPSLLTPAQLTEIIEALEAKFDFSTLAEFTMELNPSSITPENLRQYRDLGVNRLSIGVQSFVDSELDFLGRLHNADTAERTVRAAQEAGFDNISLDLIFAVPGQTVESLDYSINRALKLNPRHLSVYCLIYEENTALSEKLNQGLIEKYDDDTEADMYEFVMSKLKSEGFQHYEVSNYCRPHHECRHNMNYWGGKEYFAFGPAAHGYLNRTRYSNIEDLDRYADNLKNFFLPVAEQTFINRKEQIIERAFLGLRAAGIYLDSFKKDFNWDIYSANREFFEKLQSEQYITITDNVIALTDKGFLLSDEIESRLISNIRSADL